MKVIKRNHMQKINQEANQQSWDGNYSKKVQWEVRLVLFRINSVKESHVKKTCALISEMLNWKVKMERLVQMGRQRYEG